MKDLKAQLRDPAGDRDPAQRRESLKQVISYMTSGIDTSTLAPDVIMAAATKDLVCKKMVYLYISAYADVSPDITIMAISTLQKDCHDDSPIVRGLALRTISTLRLPGITEHTVPLLTRALNDSSSYVRKTGVLGLLRLYKADKATFEALNVIPRLEILLRDGDPNVAVNAFAALEEIFADKGGVPATKALLYFFLNRRDLSEWQLCTVLELLLRYSVESDDEMFTIMNKLEEKLRGTNAAVILGTARVFLHLTSSHPALHRQVVQRLREPLLTLFATTPVETAYAVLTHIHLLAQRDPTVFADCIRDFYIRMTDPTYMKIVKADILITVATDETAGAVCDEMSQLVGDIVPAMARKAIRGVTTLAVRLPNVAPRVANMLREWLESDAQHIRGEALVAVREFAAAYRTSPFVPPILEMVPVAGRDVDDVESLLAYTTILGDFCKEAQLPKAPYLLEDVAASWADQPEAVQLQLLTSVTKCFFARAPETHALLARLLKAAIADDARVVVRERALLYYRLLRGGIGTAEKVITASPPAQSRTAAEDDDAELHDALLDEFNTFSVPYGIPSSRYLGAHDSLMLGGDSSEDDAASEDDEGDDADDVDDAEAANEGRLGHALAPAADGGDVHNGGTKGPRKRLTLVHDPEIDEATYSELWEALPVAHTTSLALRAQPPVDTLDGHLARHNIMCIAGGAPDGVVRALMHAQATKGADAPHYLVDITVQADGPLEPSWRATRPNSPWAV